MVTWSNVKSPFNSKYSGPDRNKQQSDLIAVSKLMVVIAVIETSLEANYQLYINFILFTPNILRDKTTSLEYNISILKISMHFLKPIFFLEVIEAFFRSAGFWWLFILMILISSIYKTGLYSLFILYFILTLYLTLFIWLSVSDTFYLTLCIWHFLSGTLYLTDTL